MKEYLQPLKSSQKVQLTILFGFIVQLIFCVTAVGYFHPDQHFQIIEFSSYQLHLPNAATAVWELESSIRPTFQVYIFSAFRICCHFFSIDNPFHQLTILRLLQGVLFFIILNAMALWYCKKKNERKLILVLLLLNFSWILVYTRTLLSSEILSAIFFFPAIMFFQKWYEENKINFIKSVVVGILLALSFYLRFQIAFAIIGFALWIFFIEKQFRLSFYILLGFFIGICFNVFLDAQFYHKLVFTPYLYFKTNILEGVAASFGEKSFTYYILILMAVVSAPFLSIAFFYQYAKTSIQNLKHPLVLSVLFFIIGHCIVGHKEERFMFTIINVIPIIIGLNDSSFKFLESTFKWRKLVTFFVIFSVALNSILLVLFVFNPYSQSISFIDKLSNHFSKQKQAKIYCYQRTPLQTESHLPLTYYSGALKNVELININNIDSITKNSKETIWLTGTFNDIKDNFNLIDSLGYKPQLYSSSMLWNINLLLQKKKINTVNDIWVLYKLR